MAELKQVLDYKSLLLITINAIMGTGIFFLVAIGAREAGPASLLSWLLISIVSIYIAACFGELTSMFPKSGGIYEFCKQAYGKFPSFMIGWTSIIAGNITIAMLIVGAIQYLLPKNLPWVQIPISLAFIFAFNYIAFRGMKISAVMLIAFAFITIGTLLGIIVPGLFRFSIENFTPFFALGASNVFLAIFFISETFFGWETATFLAEETKDGKRVMPRALVTGTIIIALISLALVVASLSVIHWKTFGYVDAPLKELAFVMFGSFGKDIFTILVYLSIIGSVAGWIVASPRLILAMSRDKLFFKQFEAVHDKYNTPHKAIIFQTILSSVLVFIGAGSYEVLLTLLVPLVILMYAAVIISVTVLRIRQPNTTRYYNVWFPRAGPVITAMILFAILGVWLFEAENAVLLLKIGGSLILLGFPVYFLLEMYYNPEFIKKLNNSLSLLALLTENFSLPKKVRNQIILLLGNIKDKTVLELGCNVGTLTKVLAKEVGIKGKVIATDIAVKDVEIAKRRLQHLPNVNIIYHEDPNSLHPEIPYVDAVVSAGHLSDVQEATKVLALLNKKLQMHDKICFLEYDKLFWIIPNIPWMNNDESIMRVFSHSGFTVSVLRKRGIFWQYIYIYGRKEANV